MVIHASSLQLPLLGLALFIIYNPRGTWSSGVHASDISDAGRDPTVTFRPTINRSHSHNTGVFATVELTFTPYQAEK